MSDPKKPRVPQWKQKAAAPAARPAAAKQDENWRDRSADRGGTPARPWGVGRNFLIGLATTVFLGLIAGAIAWIILPKPPVDPQFVLLSADYAENLAVPHNVAGKRAVEAIQEWGASDESRQFTTVPLIVNDEKDIADLFTKGKPKKLIVYVAAHGVVTRTPDGEPVLSLVPQDYSPSEHPKGLVPFKAVLDKLESLKGTPKLLILDVATIRTAETLGQLAPSFVDYLTTDGAYKRQIDGIPDLVVITSTSKDQHSWVAPAWGTTIFAHAVLEGLKGAAGPGEQHAQKLFDHVEQAVERWARVNRERKQQPQLLNKDRAAAFGLPYVDAKPPAPTPAAPPAPSQRLADAWAKCEKLHQQTPPPWTAAPAPWRRYVETLLRAEELTRVGVSADNLLDAADTLHKELKPPDATFPSSIGHSGPMGRVFEQPLTAAELDLVKDFKSHLDIDDHARCLEDVKRVKATDKREKLVRTRLAEELVRHVAGKPKEYLTQSRGRKPDEDLLWQLNFTQEPKRSAEAHQLLMLRSAPLQALLQDARADKLLEAALKTRVLAEEAAVGLSAATRADAKTPAFSEQVLRWVRADVVKADALRRPAEDRLASAQEVSWKRAEDGFAEAAKLYEAAQAVADRVRRAMRERNRALAQLPFYSRWLAEDGPSDAVARDHLILWKQAHALDALLRGPVKDAANQTKEMDELAKEIEKGMEAVAARYKAAYDGTEAGRNQIDWHRKDRLLRVPLIAGDLRASQRATQAKNLQDIAEALQQRLDDKGEAGAGQGTAGADTQEAKRHAAFALAAVDEAKVALDTLDLVEVKPGALSRPGDQVARKRVEWARKAEKGHADAIAGKTLADMEQKLTDAAGCARLVEGWAQGTVLKHNPAAALRDLQLYELLCWQAERTYRDHWAGFPEPTAAREPYYYLAARGYLEDANRRVNDLESIHKFPRATVAARYAAVKTLVEKPSTFALEWSASGVPTDFHATPAGVPITDEESIPRFYRLVMPKDVAAETQAHPVRWVKKVAKLAVGDGDQAAREQPLDERIDVEIKPEKPASERVREPVQHTVAAYFRGREEKCETRVQLYDQPDTLFVSPISEALPRVAVRADRALFAPKEKLAISIVLDCSGSMTETLPGTSKRRWDAATEALENVLSQLPNGVSVSLRVYGSKSIYEDPARTARQKSTDSRQEWPTHEWNKDHLKGKMQAVKELKPAGDTPLLRTIAEARKDFPAAFEGRKVMLVITDGGDSNFYYTKADANYDADLREQGDTLEKFLLQTFAKPHDAIELHVVGFDIRESEIPEKQDYIRRSTREMPDGIRAVKGRYYSTDDSGILANHLNGILSQMGFLVDADTGVNGANLDTHGGSVTPRNAESDALYWVDVKPGAYWLQIPSLRGEVTQQRIRLQDGDSLVINLEDGILDSKPGFRRCMYGRGSGEHGLARHGWAVTSRDEGVIAKHQGWVVSALQNEQRANSDHLKIMTTLQQDQPKANPGRHLQVVHPSWVWYELKDPDKKSRPFQVFPKAGFQAPAWGIDVPSWPAAADGRKTPVTLETWWTDIDLNLTHAGRTDLGRRLTTSPGQTFPEYIAEHRAKGAEKDGVVLEAFEAKRVPLPLPDGERAAGGEPPMCLIVRLRYPPGNGPYFVKLGDFDKLVNFDVRVGQANQWYHEEGRYTGIFWSPHLTPERMLKLGELHVLSVKALKARSYHHSLFLDAPSPTKQPPGR